MKIASVAWTISFEETLVSGDSCSMAKELVVDVVGPSSSSTGPVLVGTAAGSLGVEGSGGRVPFIYSLA